jgi:hypothetical protein
MSAVPVSPVVDKKTCVVLRDGKFDLTTKSDLDSMFQHISLDPNKTLVVHFHGGLVGLQSGISSANWLNTLYSAANATPLFFIWESGWDEIIAQKMQEISGERIFQQLMMHVTQFAKAKIDQFSTVKGAAAKGIGLLHPDPDLAVFNELDKATATTPAEPFAGVNPSIIPSGEELTATEVQQFQDAIKNDPVIQIEAAAIANSLQPPVTVIGPAYAKGIGVKASRYTLMSPNVLDDMRSPADGSKGIVSLSTVRIIAGAVKILIRVIERFSRHRDHGLYRTVLEEVMREYYVANVGKFLWDGMKQATVDAFGADAGVYGGAAFLEGLKALDSAGKLPKRIVLVGHSAGSIYIANLLAHAQSVLPAHIVFDVIFIAPAVTFQFLNQTLVSNGTRVGRMRIFGMDDQKETANALVPAVPFLYPASLLYFVSGVLEDEADKPLVGMQRYYSGRPPYDASGTPDVAALRGFRELTKPNALDWALCTVGQGCDTDMASHGGLEQAPVLMASVQYIIKNGY